MRRILFAWSIIFAVVVASGCRRNVSETTLTTTDSVITHAELLKLERTPHYTIATIADPWNGGILHRYVLVPRDSTLPGNLPEGTVVRTPIERALVYSAVHTAIMRELNAIEAVKGVVDVQFFTDPDIVEDVRGGRLTDCGSSMAPTIERVIDMSPDAIMLSPYQDATYGQITKLNIPIIECADYMETTPLGRAEWVKFYGELTGRRAEADSLFNAVATRYDEIKEASQSAGAKRPMVLTEMVIQGVWNVPGGDSYMARLIADAGGDYPWADDKSKGSLNLDFNQVLAKAHQADVWLIKSFYIHSLADLKGANALNDRFDAFAAGHVYVCDTNSSRLFERFPFHPEVLLQEYHNIFYNNGTDAQFFKRLDR